MSDDADRISVTFDEEEGRRSVAVVTFERPPVNAIDGRTKDELISITRSLSNRRGLGAVVIQGGDHFAAGDDIKEMAAVGREFALRGNERISEAASAVAAIPFPVVAAVKGYALGGGCELALAADFRVTAGDAIWGLPEIHLGLIPGGGGTQRLARLIGIAKAKKMIYLGDTMSGTEAVAIGIADEAVPADNVVNTAIALARELATRSPVAIRAAKRAIDSGIATDLEAGLQLEEALFSAVFASADAAEGLASFIDKGPRSAVFETDRD
jgi:enoyl-CoA hydratase/carnithine racemase